MCGAPKAPPGTGLPAPTLLDLRAVNTLDATNVAVAFGTLVLAFFTWKAARASQEAARASQTAAEATEAAAQAARDEADATVSLAHQAEHDRELAWRPHLVIDIQTSEAGSGSRKALLTVSNVGRGAALSAVVWVYDASLDGQWGLTPPMVVGPGTTSNREGLPLDRQGTGAFPVASSMEPPSIRGASASSSPPVSTCSATAGDSSATHTPRCADLAKRTNPAGLLMPPPDDPSLS